MNLHRLLQINLVLFILMTCTMCQEPMVINPTQQVVEKPSPIRLNEGQTTIPLADYINEPSELIAFKCSGNFDCTLSKDKSNLLILSNKISHPYGNLNLTFEDGGADILLINSTNQEVVFSMEDENQSAKKVSIVSSLNDWNPAATPMKYNAGQWTVSLNLKPGVYGYQFVVDDEWMLDPANDKQISNGIGGFNSELRVAYPEDLTLSTSSTKGTLVTLKASETVDSVYAYINNYRVKTEMSDDGAINIDLASSSTFPNRTHLSVWASNEKGGSNDILIPVKFGRALTSTQDLNRWDRHRQIMYFLMVDRFNNADKSNDRPEADPEIHPLANQLGGDLKGVLKKLNDGYFDKIGMNTIWLSPIPKNPDGAFGLWDKGGVRSKFSAYHGYWPISFTQIDDRFGTPNDLKKLVATAHDRDDNVILDFVANHVHELHPVYQAHKEEGWATDLYLPDGSLNTERWDDHRLTTWFDVFLPTLNLERKEITEMVSDSAMYWLYEYDLDGFRHDATKHIPLEFWRTLTKKVKHHNEGRGAPIYQVGETYGSPELISSYVGSGMLDGQFDFNFYDASVASIVLPDVGFDLLGDRIRESFAFYGHHHLMGNMTGNQDKPRFISLASGDITFEEDSKLAGWTRDIEKRTQESFDKLAMMHALLISVPGIPCIYYGDEIGLPGGNDPDNRRMMKFENLTDQESHLRQTVSDLAHMRTSHMALLYGATEVVLAAKDQLILKRSYFDEIIYTIFNTSDTSFNYTLDLAEGNKISKIYPNDKKGKLTKSMNIEPNQFKIIIVN